MATARDDNRYGGGLGTGGKFRKQPFRRAQTTPYDRPPTALRTQTNNGWLSKIVDPAHRLITYGAHRLFSSIFRKRLPPIPTTRLQEASQEVRYGHQEPVLSDPAAAQEGPIDVSNPSNNLDQGGLMELEQILKQKTFTRDEIDRLTAVLRSKTVEMPFPDKEKINDIVPLQPMVSRDRKDEFLNTPIQENGFRSRLTSIPVTSTSVLDEDLASPAELAKAYMGSRPSKASPSKLGLHSKAITEDSTVLNNVPFPSKSPIMSLVPRSSGYRGVPENGFITPRSRGRSAIYNMARTPYTRIHPYSTLKIAGRASENLCQFPWEQHGLYGSRHGDSKRGNSVLENDIGSGGPMRRIRQKQNLLSPKNSSLPVSGSPLPVQSGVGSAVQHPTSSIQKAVLLSEPKQNIRKLTENGDHSIPSTSYNPVPSKSSEMASKILQQLDKLASKEKSSPTMLSPSILHGQSHRSLKTLDPSKFCENVQDSNNLSPPSLADARNSSSEKGKKVEENGPLKLTALSGKSSPVKNRIDTKIIKDSPPDVRTAITEPSNLVGYPPQKKRAFQMSAHEDFLDQDDVYSNGTAAIIPMVEGRGKSDTSVMERKIVATEAPTVEKPPVLSEAKPIVSFGGNTRNELGYFNGSMVAEKKSSSSTVSPVSMFVPPAIEATQSILMSGKVASPKESNATSPIFSFGDKVASTMESNAVFPKFGFSSKNVDSAQQFTFAPSSTVPELPGPKFVTSDPKPRSSISSASAVASSTDVALKGLESNRADSKDSLASGAFSSEMANSSSISTSTFTANTFSFGAPPYNLSSNNASLASSKSLFSSTTPPLVFNSATTATTATTAISPVIATATTTTSTGITSNSHNSSASTSAASVSVPSAPFFKFGSPIAPSTETPQVSAASGSVEGKVNQDRGFGNLTSSPFYGGSSSLSAMASTGGSNFGFNAAAAVMSSTASNQMQGSNPFCTNSGSLPSAQLSPAGSGVATFTQSTPIQVGSSPSFGSSGITAFSAGNSLFGSSAPASKLFSSGATFGLNSSNSAEAGSSLQPTKSTPFGSTSSSAGFSFGTSSVSNGATNSPMVFGLSTGASNSGFSFTAAAATATTTTLSQPVFGSPNSGFTFGSAPSGNSDQMSMEDSMAEDSVQATTPTLSAFGQQPILTPSSGFMFGSAAPSGANPFQFGSQQNLSPFQASGSLEFGAGGSFSLGTGGGDKPVRKFVRVRKTRKN